MLVLLLLSLSASASHAVDESTASASLEEPASLGYTSAEFWGQIVAIIALVVCSGIVAGLTLGLMSQDVTNLAILAAAGTPKQRKHAARIMPLRKNGHLVLTSLLLTNTVLNETLPILCDGLFGKGYLAVILSTVLLVLFSEIIPQAICSRNGLAIGAFFAVPVRVLIALWYIIAWPIAKILDSLLGKHHGVAYNVSELCELVGLHSQSHPSHPGPLDQDTVLVARNVLAAKTAEELLNNHGPPSLLPPCELQIHGDDPADYTLLECMLAGGYTALPVYDQLGAGQNQDTNTAATIMGVLTTSKLLSVLRTTTDKIPVRTLQLDPISKVPASTPLPTLLRILQTEPSHLVQVVGSSTDEDRATASSDSSPDNGVGIVRLEHVLASFLQPISPDLSGDATRITMDHEKIAAASSLDESRCSREHDGYGHGAHSGRGGLESITTCSSKASSETVISKPSVQE